MKQDGHTGERKSVLQQLATDAEPDRDLGNPA
jgi:hypothetical protein